MTTESPTTDSIPDFTAAQRYDIVLSFIKSLIGGQISMELANLEELEMFRDNFEFIATEEQKRSLKGLDMRKVNPKQLLSIHAERTNQLIGIVMHTIQASEQERRNAVDHLITFILDYRIGGKIKGEFLAIPNIESRVTRLEEKITSQADLIQELRILMKALVAEEKKSP